MVKYKVERNLELISLNLPSLPPSLLLPRPASSWAALRPSSPPTPTSGCSTPALTKRPFSLPPSPLPSTTRPALVGLC